MFRNGISSLLFDSGKDIRTIRVICSVVPMTVRITEIQNAFRKTPASSTFSYVIDVGRTGHSVTNPPVAAARSLNESASK